MSTYPFTYNHQEPYMKQAADWIADVFYDILPEAGFELRDEQIYMAFQLEKAYSEKQTIFAEAGVGTGKTLVYLLYAAAYARFTKKPAVIACADESLIEQLMMPEGDLAKLGRHLDLAIDARLSKSPTQYLCLKKLDAARSGDEESDVYKRIYQSLPSFVHARDTMQSFHHYGDRKEYAELSDEQWARIGWDAFQDCLVCSQRHRCGQTLSREYYRKAADLIICSHDFYMEHVWTYESRKREGQLPLLPEHSSVVFDEGHLLETAAQKALTYKLKHAVFESIILRLLNGEIRESLAVAVEESMECGERLFEVLKKNSSTNSNSYRLAIELTEEVVQAVERFRSVLSLIEEELVFEGGLHTLDDYQLKIVEEHIEMIQLALSLFVQKERLITWLEQDQEDYTLVVMPRMVKEVLKERVFSQRMPIVFSSATLSADSSFDYISQSLGIDRFFSFSVASPYDYDSQMKIKLYTEDSEMKKTRIALEQLEHTGGRALLLFSSREELVRFRRDSSALSSELKYRLLFEGDAEISRLISDFEQDETSVLCAVNLWEGLDVPGPSLSQVIVWSLPFPPQDPVFAAKRQDAAHPWDEVDMPYMLLRLKQGVGRLIRGRDDQGIVTIIGKELGDPRVREQVIAALPTQEIK